MHHHHLDCIPDIISMWWFKKIQLNTNSRINENMKHLASAKSAPLSSE